MSGYKYIDEGDDSFTLQKPDGTFMPVAKTQLSPDFQNEIRGLPKVEIPQTDTTPEDHATAPPMESPQPSIPGQPDMTDSLMNPNLPGNQQYFAPPVETPTEAPPEVTPDQTNPMQQFTANQIGQYYQLYNKMGQGLQGEANAQAEGARAMAAANDAFVAQQQAYMNKFNDEKASLDQEHQQRQDAVASAKIDPERWWNRESGVGPKARKVIAMIGMFLGGNKNGQNAYMQVVQKFMDDDIKAQEDNLETQKGLLNDNLKKYGNLELARQATRLDMTSMLQAQLSKIQAQTNSQAIQERAKMGLAQLGLQIEEQKSKMANQLAESQFFGGGGRGLAGLPPAIQAVAVEHPDGKGYLQGITPADAKLAREVVGKYKQVQGVLKDAKAFMGVDDDWKPIPGSNAGPREANRLIPWVHTKQENEAEQISSLLQQGIRQMVESSGGAIRVGNNPEGFIQKLTPDMTRWGQEGVRKEMRRLEQWLAEQRDSVLSTTTIGYGTPSRLKISTTMKEGW